MQDGDGYNGLLEQRDLFGHVSAVYAANWLNKIRNTLVAKPKFAKSFPRFPKYLTSGQDRPCENENAGEIGGCSISTRYEDKPAAEQT